MNVPVSIADVQEAMKWFRALADDEKLHHRKFIARNDAISIARYWIVKIKK